MPCLHIEFPTKCPHCSHAIFPRQFSTQSTVTNDFPYVPQMPHKPLATNGSSAQSDGHLPEFQTGYGVDLLVGLRSVLLIDFAARHSPHYQSNWQVPEKLVDVPRNAISPPCACDVVCVLETPTACRSLACPGARPCSIERRPYFPAPTSWSRALK